MVLNRSFVGDDMQFMHNVTVQFQRRGFVYGVSSTTNRRRWKWLEVAQVLKYGIFNALKLKGSYELDTKGRTTSIHISLAPHK